MLTWGPPLYKQLVAEIDSVPFPPLTNRRRSESAFKEADRKESNAARPMLKDLKPKHIPVFHKVPAVAAKWLRRCAAEPVDAGSIPIRGFRF